MSKKTISNEITLSIGEIGPMIADIVRHNLEVGDKIASGARGNWQGERIVPYLRGEPGIGKTSLMWAVSDKMDLEFRSFIPAQYDPSEIAGFIFFDKDTKATWRAKPDFLPTDGRWLILADEFGQATMMQKNIMAQLIQEGRLGEHRLSPHATLVLAGNRAQDRAGVNPDPSHVLDRVTIINCTVKLDEWRIWALRNGINPMIIAYLHHRPGAFQSFDPAETKNTTPRGWAKVSEILNMQIGKGQAEATRNMLEMAMVAGTIGSATATDFHGFLRVARDLPDPDEVLRDPERAKIPPKENPNAMYAFAGAISHRINHNNAEAAVKVIRRMPADIGVMCATDAIARDPTLNKNKHMIDWKVKDAAALLIF